MGQQIMSSTTDLDSIIHQLSTFANEFRILNYESIHLFHSHIYNFIKMNVYQNPEFIFTLELEKESLIYFVLFCIACCLYLLPLAHSTPTTQKVYSEDLRHHLYWLVCLSKEKHEHLTKQAFDACMEQCLVLYGPDHPWTKLLESTFLE